MYVLENLWRIGFNPRDRHIEEDSEYDRVRKQAIEENKSFWSSLTNEQKRAFDQYCSRDSELTTLAETEAFVQGFRLGARIILDVINDYKSPMPQTNGFT